MNDDNTAVETAIRYVEERQRELPPGVTLKITNLLTAYRAKCAEVEELKTRVAKLEGYWERASKVGGRP